MSVVGKLWRGEYPLHITFWGFAFLPLLLGGSATIFMLSSRYLSKEDFMLIYPFYITLFGFYNFVSLVGLWKSAGKYNGREVWKALSWIFVVIGMYFAVTRLGLGMLIFMGQMAASH